MVRSKTDALAQGAVVAITPAAMQTLDVIRLVGVGGGEEVGLASLPAEPRTVACYLAARAGDGASIPPCVWPPPPSPRPTSGRSWSPPAGTWACAPP